MKKIGDAYSENKWYLKVCQRSLSMRGKQFLPLKFYVSLHCQVHVGSMLRGVPIFGPVHIMEAIAHVTHMHVVSLSMQPIFCLSYCSEFRLQTVRNLDFGPLLNCSNWTKSDICLKSHDHNFEEKFGKIKSETIYICVM